jgi:ABC-type polysaccharide/polyol phosphate transport system ATPase subunit
MIAGSISVKDVSKSYRLYRRPADMLAEALTGRQRHTEFRALEGITFDISPGTVLGLVGRNGAGKSTLLRIIAGTLPATSGSVSREGRVAAILELGTGFHPDYTGRENVQLGALCLGLSRAEIEQRFDDIVAFSELEDFIDQPFSTYSTGMQARLTFAVATCVDPDILIIDEALSVGDARFQLKSFDRIRDFRRRGKSILLVSHSINQIVSICDRAILIERGRMYADGDPNRIGHLYHELLFGAPALVAALELVSSDRLEELDASAEKRAQSGLSERSRETAAGESDVIDSAALGGMAGAAAGPEALSVENLGSINSLAERGSPPVRPPERAAARQQGGQSLSVLAAQQLSGNASDTCTEFPEHDAKRLSAGPSEGLDRDSPAIPMGGLLIEQSSTGEVRKPPEMADAGVLTGPVDDLESPRARGHRYGNKWATIVSVRLEDRNGHTPVLVQSGEIYRFLVDFVAQRHLPSVCIGFLIRNASGLDIIGTDTRFLECPGLPECMQAGQRCQAGIQLPLALAPGTFFFTISIVGVDTTKYDHWFDCLSFTVAPTPMQLYTSSLLAVPITSRAIAVQARLTPAETHENSPAETHENLGRH